MKILTNFEIELDNTEILRLLQAKSSEKNHKPPPSSLLNEIEELKQYAKPLIRPSAIYSEFESKNLEPRFLFKKSEKTILSICTIGKELENYFSETLRDGQLAKGVILNAIASHAAEQVADYVNQEILRELARYIEGKEVTCRFSPGYCQWELEKGQKEIFNHLDGAKIGVSLTPSMMMNPVKSVSFAINIGKEVDKGLGIRGCETCDMVNCAYRRI